MIIVSVQLLSAIDGRHDELARMEICNMGTGTATMGNYSAETLRGRSTKDFLRRTRQRIAYVSGHARQREHVWNLVAKALRNLRYGCSVDQIDPVAISQLVNSARQVAYAEHGAEEYEQLHKALEPFRKIVPWQEQGASLNKDMQS